MNFVRAPLVAVVLLGIALAGCADGDPDETTPTTSPAPKQTPMLSGWVFDPAIRPVAGVTVELTDTGTVVTTDENGFYGFPSAPRERFLVLVASKEGYMSASKQVTLPLEGHVRLNFTLQPEPVRTPRVEVQKFEGLLSCRTGITVDEENATFDCGPGTESADQWDFAVEADLAGAVIEVFWDPGTPLAESLSVRVETLELGEFNFVIGETLGSSPLRITVPQAVAAKFYPAGGLMRATVDAAPDNDANEAGIGASVAFQQDFAVFASLFYVEPPPGTYTVAQT